MQYRRPRPAARASRAWRLRPTPGRRCDRPGPRTMGAVQRIGVDAGRRFAEIADPRVARCADDPPIEADAAARRGGRRACCGSPSTRRRAATSRWVSSWSEPLRRSLHVEEVSVAPGRRARRGHGGRLLDGGRRRGGVPRAPGADAHDLRRRALEPALLRAPRLPGARRGRPRRRAAAHPVGGGRPRARSGTAGRHGTPD